MRSIMAIEWCILASSVLYLIQNGPDQQHRWRESVEMALTSAAFAQPTRVWLGLDALIRLVEDTEADEYLTELTGFGVTCVADRAHHKDGAPAAIQWLDADALRALRENADHVIVL